MPTPSQQPVSQHPIPGKPWFFVMQPHIVVPGLVVLFVVILVLFPFDWLGNVWPAYAHIFDIVFATPLSHMIGHATLFFIASLLILFSFPALRRRPVLYFTIMLIGAICEEALQSLFKLSLPTIWDGRDLLLDSLGIIVGYCAVRLWGWLRSRSQKMSV